MRKVGIAAALAACIVTYTSGLTVMTYNVENLFDDVHNGTEYQEFDPAGGTWTPEFFKLRVDSIAEVIRKAVPGGADVLLLQEVENENALKALVESGLRGMGYSWKAFVTKKGLSANVAIISRFPIARVRTHAVGPWKGETPLRDVVEADITVSGHTLYVLDNHWKAKTEGAKVTEPFRRNAAGVLARRIEEILAQDPNADIIAAGDMNESLDEYRRTGRKYQTALIPETERSSAMDTTQSIFLSSRTAGLGVVGNGCILYEPWYEIDDSRRGSYFYQGDWLTVDHMLLSPGLFDARGFSYHWGSFGPVRLSFLLSDKGSPKGWSSFTGDRGYSDHLPLLLSLDLKN
jgi:endonuclease/exonuclease/phosphatase family metal-dependent hydrolase